MEKRFTDLVNLVSALRGENGCPWDRKQTTKSFRTFLLEEVYELIEAIEKDDYGLMRGELGDLLFHIVFITRICEEKGLFAMPDVLDNVVTKMKRRHPHVFGPAATDNPAIEVRWEEIKKEEGGTYRPLTGVPSTLPALSRAYLISRRAAKMGFDWEKLDHVYEKVEEELAELKEARGAGDQAQVEEELGDLLFTIVNVARFQGVDPESALRGTIDKFIRRFSYIEEKTDPAQSDLKTMDALWNEAKRKEKKGP